MARRLVEMAASCVMCRLLLNDASQAPELFAKSTNVYFNFAEAEVEKHAAFIRNFNKADLENYKK